MSGLSALLVGSAGSLSHESGVGVELVKSLGVVEGVVLGGLVEDSVGLGGSDSTLDFVGVDDSGNVGVGDLTARKVVALLLH